MRRVDRAALLIRLCCWLGCCFYARQAQAVPPHGTLSLSEAYRLALRDSEQVQIAVGNRDIADSNYTDQLTLMGPTITATVRGNRENDPAQPAIPGQPAGVGLQPPYNFAALANVSQPLFRRQIFDARRAAKLGVNASIETLARARQQLMMDVSTVFIAVLNARTQVIVAQGAVKRGEASLAIADKRFKAGAALPTAVLLAQIELNRAQTSVNTAEGQLRQQESSFERLVGQVPPEVLTLPETPSRAAIDEAMRRAHEERADLRSLHYSALQARALVSSLQDKIFWPTLDAAFSGGYTVLAPSEGGGDFRYPVVSISGVLTVPFFQTGDEFVQVRIQKQRAYVAAYQESFLRRQVGDDVRQAVAQLETADKAIEISDQQQKTAEKDYQIVTRQYNSGAQGVTPLDVVTAQGAVFEAETNKALAQYAREIATYRLLFAEGKINL